MNTLLSALVSTLRAPLKDHEKIIEWGSPVVAFGDPAVSRIASLGLNPSNREFVDAEGNELNGPNRRFPTLGSLGIHKWSSADYRHVGKIIESCKNYFRRNPYDIWFKKLDKLLTAAGFSFYSEESPACHLDLVPFATSCKWTFLSNEEIANLLTISSETLMKIVRDSPIRTLLLNGKSVVMMFEKQMGISLKGKEMPLWSLPRKNSADVIGYSYEGYATRLASVDLEKEVQILGFNHNIQSSFGVTREVISQIATWIGERIKHETP